MTGSSFLAAALAVSGWVLALALLLVLYRAWRGPTLPDRVVAGDMASFVIITWIGLVCLGDDQFVYVDAALTLALVAFLATVALARYVEWRTAATRDPERVP